jgi:F-type H+-transporting ATPase subunit a
MTTPVHTQENINIENTANVETQNMHTQETEVVEEKSLINQILFPHPHMPAIKADILGNVNNWPIANSTMFLFFIIILFSIFAFFVSRFKVIPGKFQSIVEMLIESITNLLASLTSGKDHRAKELFLPIVSIFLIIGSINIIGSFPIINQITWNDGHHIIPMFRKATADINTTLPLALAIVISMQVLGVRNWGFFGYFKRFFPIHILVKEAKHGAMGVFTGIIELFVGLLELVSEFVKVISLSLRLFGNMFAGEILLAILMGIFAIGLPAIWLGFDMLVAVIQTIVIGCLASVYYLFVVKEDGQEGH